MAVERAAARLIDSVGHNIQSHDRFIHIEGTKEICCAHIGIICAQAITTEEFDITARDANGCELADLAQRMLSLAQCLGLFEISISCSEVALLQGGCGIVFQPC